VGELGTRCIEPKELLKAAPAPARRFAQRGLEVALAAVAWDGDGEPYVSRRGISTDSRGRPLLS